LFCRSYNQLQISMGSAVIGRPCVNLKTAASARTAAAAARAVADSADDAADAATYAAACAADYAAAATYAATYAAACAAAGGDFWETVDPIGVLERMTYLNVETPE
jgi:hypothetical protein